MKLVVLSDLHLTPPGEPLNGGDPHARLDAAIARINSAYADADLVALAGDLTDLGRTAAYAALRDRLGDLRPPWAATLGNHDNRDVFARVFGADRLDENGFAQSAHDLGCHRVLLLDTLEKGPSPAGGWGARHGWLCDARLDWLESHLDDRPTVIVLHHPATRLGIRWNDLSLRAPERLQARLAGRDLRAVIAGHVHMVSMTWRAGVPYVTLAGSHTSSREAFGTVAGEPRARRTGPGQMAVVLGDAEQTVIHFDDFWDAHPEIVP